jgi:hypothetical protein
MREGTGLGTGESLLLHDGRGCGVREVGRELVAGALDVFRQRVAWKN